MSIYKNYSIEQLENLYSNYLIDSWSYSKVSAFARNEKAFEMNYIYGIKSKRSATTISGEAYHEALRFYFNSIKNGSNTDVIELEKVAFEYIEQIPANRWKLQKTTETVDECISDANKSATSAIRNFLSEIDTYMDDIESVIDVEVNGTEFLTVNGVDIPIPCNFKIDLVVKTKRGTVAVIDHKSKKSFTDEKELELKIGEQGIVYAIGYESKTGQKIDEVWFIENKVSKNKDNSPQLRPFKITLDSDVRKLYETMLYEPLKKMIEAVSNPDYTYLINHSDNFTDMAELYDHWARTMICEVDDFNVEESKKHLVAKRLRKIKDSSLQMIPPQVIKNFKQNASKFISYDMSTKDMTAEQKIEHALRSFGIVCRVAHSFSGTSSNTFLLEVQPGTPIKSVISRRLDLANVLDVASVRIPSDLFVYQNKSYVGIEYGKKRDGVLYYDDSLAREKKLPLGKDNFGNVIFWDLKSNSTNNALVCGATGSGKSVLLKNLILSAESSGVDEIIVLDPKNEFEEMHNNYSVFVYSGFEDIEMQVRALRAEMERRVREKEFKYTLVILDEATDAYMNQLSEKERTEYKISLDGYYANGNPKTSKVKDFTWPSLEENIQMILQKGRSTGFRTVLAFQRADSKIITGNAKVNLPLQICFRVPKAVDSMVVIDEQGAESLQGEGDGLLRSPDHGLVRFQAFYKPKEQTA